MRSRDVARARRLAERLDYGIVSINNHGFTGAVPALPWSGTRDTGFGVANGAHSLATFVRPRATVVDGASAPELFWMPYDATLWELGQLLADAQLGRLARAWRLPLVLRDRLKTLRAARLVKFRAEAQRRIYELDLAGVDEVATWISDIRRFWATRLDALESEARKDAT